MVVEELVSHYTLVVQLTIVFLYQANNILKAGFSKSAFDLRAD